MLYCWLLVLGIHSVISLASCRRAIPFRLNSLLDTMQINQVQLGFLLGLNLHRDRIMHSIQYLHNFIDLEMLSFNSIDHLLHSKGNQT